MIRLFNGRNLDGWYTYIAERGKHADPKHVFSVEDGLLHITGEEFGCITTNEPYANYRLIAEYKWGEKTWSNPEKKRYDRLDKARDNGILIHSVGKDGAYWDCWMLSIEVQIIEGGTGDLLLVNDQSDKSLIFTATVPAAPEKQEKCWVYQPGGQMQTQKDAGRINWFGRDPDWKDVKGFRGKRDIEKPVGEWNRIEVIATGDSLKYILNGVTVNEVFKVQPNKGRIQIQSEGAEIFYRKIDLKPLPLLTSKPE